MAREIKLKLTKKGFYSSKSQNVLYESQEFQVSSASEFFTNHEFSFIATN